MNESCQGYNFVTSADFSASFYGDFLANYVSTHLVFLMEKAFWTSAMLSLVGILFTCLVQYVDYLICSLEANQISDWICGGGPQTFKSS